MTFSNLKPLSLPLIYLVNQVHSDYRKKEKEKNTKVLRIPLDFAVVSLHIHGLLLATAPCLENYSTVEEQKHWGRGGGTHGGQETLQ